MTAQSKAAPGWRDDPIDSVGQDRLNRAPFAKHAAVLIDENHSANSSVVYGLEGPWGSGKSSLIALVETFLAATEDSDWRIVPFTPWATTGTEGLLQEFFAALSTVAPRTGTQRLATSIATYANIARPVMAAIPVVGAAVAEASRTAEQVLRKPWNVAFDEVATNLRELGIPILVVVDDIDRLQPTELLDLLKVVRLLGRFPGVDFLLAYDEETVVDTLRDPSRGLISTSRARAFMEKIVQYPLRMPPLLNGAIIRMLAAGLTDIITPERVDRDFEAQRFSRVLTEAVPSQLSTPRAVERFLAQVRMQFHMHDRFEINDVDLVLATLARVQFPDLFSQLQRWKSPLTRTSPIYEGYGHRDSEPDWEQLLGFVEDEYDRRDARAIMQVLFPAILSAGASTVAPGRFAHPDYFDRYLAQTMPEGDIPDAAVTKALHNAAAGKGEDLRAMVTSPDAERATLALSKIRARYPDVGVARVSAAVQTPAPLSIELLAEGMRLVGQLEDENASWSSSLSLTSYWMINVLRLLIVDDPKADVEAALDACVNSRRRAHVISGALRDSESLTPAVHDALLAVLRREATRSIPIMLENLRQRDDAPEHPGVLSMYLLVQEAGLLAQVERAVRQGLEAGEYTLADVAARFVSFSYVIGGAKEPHSAAFSGELFSIVTGVSAKSGDMDERGTWADVSWRRRKEFASRYVPALQAVNAAPTEFDS